ncbi:twin-arginine translocase TatA/TatE family subunit [Fibrobacter succinogenes]|uniref:twin-arginine translocase TatA/TatE family subunit n=1 Tax=Fibrobacter succinogenes TaxID=833 RepID=UPI0015640F88|nr:twin-arginine translocase TatA/TatE family subunit [Fibrobacter succinogenes]
MKTLTKLTLAILIGAATFATAKDENGWATIYETLAAFEDRPGAASPFNRPGYVKPIIENLGNVLNSNWYVSANVPQSLTFEFGLPVALIPINSEDRTFTEKNILGQPNEVPTIFGGQWDPVTDPAGLNVYGNETLNGLSVFSYPYLQFGVSMFHARIVLRGMWLPPISELRGFNLLGFGLQYSFGRWFQYMLPKAAQGLDVSLVFGYNSSSIKYKPKDYSGQLNLDVGATTFDVVIGYKPFNFFEVLMTLGYQSATMKASGHLEQEANPAMFVNPNISVDGNCGFKFGLAVAFQLGKTYHPVIGFDYAGKSSFTTNVIYLRQQFGEDKTPDEIAKDKGYVRGAKKEESNAAVEQTSQEAQQELDQETEQPAEESAADEPATDDTSAETESEDEIE